VNWKDKRVLVTGADGFIGSHLVEALAREGAKVRAFCMYNSNGSWGWLDTTDSEIRSSLDVVLGDVRDARFVEQACREIEVVFHLAALIAIPYSYVAPESFVDTNVRGTLNVLEAVRQNGCLRLVHASTSEVYGTPDTVPIRETHTLKGQSPYSASKIAADKLCEAYACSFGTPAVVLRPFNTYGPRQSPRAVLASILLQLLGGAKEVRVGSLWPKRDFNFVEDTVRGFMLAGSANLEPGDVIQLGTGRAVSIGELFEAACGSLGVQARAIFEPIRARPEQSEVAILLSDASRARERLGWSAEVSLDEGLRRTAKWMESNRGAHQLEHYYV
jgi:NAD dependent epimerase/dehydratase